MLYTQCFSWKMSMPEFMYTGPCFEGFSWGLYDRDGLRRHGRYHQCWNRTICLTAVIGLLCARGQQTPSEDWRPSCRRRGGYQPASNWTSTPTLTHHPARFRPSHLYILNAKGRRVLQGSGLVYSLLRLCRLNTKWRKHGGLLLT